MYRFIFLQKLEKIKILNNTPYFLIYEIFLQSINPKKQHTSIVAQHIVNSRECHEWILLEIKTIIKSSLIFATQLMIFSRNTQKLSNHATLEGPPPIPSTGCMDWVMATFYVLYTYTGSITKLG